MKTNISLLLLCLISSLNALEIPKGRYIIGDKKMVSAYAAQVEQGKKEFLALPKARQKTLRNHGIKALTKNKKIKASSFKSLCLKKNDDIRILKRTCKKKLLRETEKYKSIKLTCGKEEFKKTIRFLNAKSFEIYLEALKSEKDTVIKRIFFLKNEC